MSQKDTKHDSTTQSIALARSDWKQFDADDDAGAAAAQSSRQPEPIFSFFFGERERDKTQVNFFAKAKRGELTGEI